MLRRENMLVDFDNLLAFDVFRLAAENCYAGIPGTEQALAHAVSSAVRVTYHDVPFLIHSAEYTEMFLLPEDDRRPVHIEDAVDICPVCMRIHAVKSAGRH